MDTKEKVREVFFDIFVGALPTPLHSLGSNNAGLFALRSTEGVVVGKTSSGSDVDWWIEYAPADGTFTFHNTTPEEFLDVSLPSNTNNIANRLFGQYVNAVRNGYYHLTVETVGGMTILKHVKEGWRVERYNSTGEIEFKGIKQEDFLLKGFNLFLSKSNQTI